MTVPGVSALAAEQVRVGVVVTFDLGRPRHGSSLSASRLPEAVKVGRDPRYFDEGLFRALWQLGPVVSGRLNACSAPTTWPAQQGAVGLKGAEVEITAFLHDFGFGAIFAVVSLPTAADTDAMLWAANCVADAKFMVTLADGRGWSLTQAIAEVRSATVGAFGDLRTSVQRTYSMIHIIELNQALLADVSPGETIYARHEREFHALSVRVLSNWRDRFPEGSPLGERNTSVAPSGVLRFNARNVLIYEHPYSAEEVESLFYPALVEMRLWDFMASVELVELRALTSNLDERTDRLRTAADLARSRHTSLRIAGEFEALSACTSKRTKQFYRSGINEFGLNETLSVLRDRATQIEGVLSRLVLGDEVRRDAEFASQQRDLAMRTQEAARRTEGTTTVLRALGLLVVLQVALNVSGVIGLSAGYQVLIGVMSVTLTLLCAMVVQRSSERRGRVRLSQEEWLSATMSVDAMFSSLLRLATTSKIAEIQRYHVGDLVITFPFACAGWKGTARVSLSDETDGRVFSRSELLLSSVGRVPFEPPIPSAVGLLESVGISGLSASSATRAPGSDEIGIGDNYLGALESSGDT
jgi:hypothetical protein